MHLKLQRAALPALGLDWKRVHVSAVTGHYGVVQIRMTDMDDPTRWEVPADLFDTPKYTTVHEQPEQGVC